MLLRNACKNLKSYGNPFWKSSDDGRRKKERRKKERKRKRKKGREKERKKKRIPILVIKPRHQNHI